MPRSNRMTFWAAAAVHRAAAREAATARRRGWRIDVLRFRVVPVGPAHGAAPRGEPRRIVTARRARANQAVRSVGGPGGSTARREDGSVSGLTRLQANLQRTVIVVPARGEKAGSRAVSEPRRRRAGDPPRQAFFGHLIMLRRLSGAIFSLCILLGATAGVRAGGGPERTLLVVNADSPLSLQVANEYVRLRGLAASHVCHIEGPSRLDVIPVEEFRTRIWTPIRAHLERERINDTIDTVVYSADFPYGVDFKADLDADQNAKDLPENLRKFAVGSLTGLTYFAHRVMAKDTFYQTLFANSYFRRPCAGGRFGRMHRAEQALHKKAMELARAGKWSDAIVAFDTLFERYDGDWQTWLGYARALAETGRMDAARGAVAAAVRRGLAHADRLDAGALATLKKRADLQQLLQEIEIANRGAPAAVAFAPDPRGGVHRYWMSTCLAYTGLRGNSGPETIAALGRAAAADGTRPDGSVYLLVNKDVRARTREPAFADTARALRALGRKVEVIKPDTPGQDGRLPKGKDDVIGAVVGVAGFKWEAAGSKLLPGAVIEHLTSFGAFFRTAGQTKASVFLRHGAAGTSGAVIEPYAIPEKFPHPSLHVYYAEGASLAEAFYQSVHAPYQLLVMGDPLTRPFARFAEVKLAAPSAAASWKGVVEVRAAVRPAAGCPPARLELWVDGRLAAGAAPGAVLPFDTTTVADGAHHLRLVMVDATRVATRSSVAVEVRVDNRGRKIEAVVKKPKVALDQVVKLAGRAPGAKRVEIRQGARVLAVAVVKGGAWKAEVPAAVLGVGEPRVTACAGFAAGPEAWSAPIALTIVAPKPLSAKKKSKPGVELDGLQAEVTDTAGAKHAVLLSTLDDYRGRSAERDLRAAKVKQARRLVVHGRFQAKTEGLQQLMVRAAGTLTITLDGRVVVAKRELQPDRPVFVPLTLAAGWHDVHFDSVAPGVPRLVVHLGGAGVTEPLAGRRPPPS